MKRVALVVVLLVGLSAGWVWFMNQRDEGSLSTSTSTPTPPGAGLVARGAYLARAGNCMGCHTLPGGPAYGGGRGVPTPFGTVYAPNLTPDVATGIGAWTNAEFWGALHNGRSRDGRLLYPAFPYPNYTQVTREDSDAIHAYLQSLPAVVQPNRPHALQFPFDRQVALAVWRALYFHPAQHAPDSSRSAEWNRGAYLVDGLGHCNACHSSRNALGASSSPLDLAGGLIPVQNWYAPSLADAEEAGVGGWETQQVVDLLRTGVSAQGQVTGPMSEVVQGSTQHLSEPDLRAMATYLKALAPASAAARTLAPAAGAAMAGPGGKLYEQHCAGCHGDAGEGVPGAYPALAGNRAVTLPVVANLVHIVLEGGFAPATAGNPRPYGMPPFATVLGDEALAQLLSFIRGSWGNQAGAVSALDVARFRDDK